MLPLAEVVNWAELAESVAASVVAALGLTIVVSLGIRGNAKFVDYSQEGRPVIAYMALAVGGLSLVLTAGLIIFGIYLMVAG
jgi:hypothetical protein